MSYMKREYVYRIMCEADIPAALILWQSIDGLVLDHADEPPALMMFLARNPDLSEVVLDGEQLVATLLCGEDGRRATLYHLCVAESHRGQGIAKHLLQRAEVTLRQRGIRKMRLLVLGSNITGNHFWCQQGWQQQTSLNYFSKSL
ncbi:MAG: GNAT family N-acetyltransferase [Cardiobacteriaceae bacterium]|nr:GNAT family N-acetyltransferase [Cardiobacteriaceae bacterium]